MTWLADFIRIVSGTYFTEERSRWTFRGHSDSAWPLVPVAGRVARTSKDHETFERSLLVQFKRESLPLLPMAPASDFEWLALGRHHGLPTRLLDWSFNPLVALYFAAQPPDDRDGEIHALRSERRLPDALTTSGNPFELGEPMKYLPRALAGRVIAQEGLFTIQPDPGRPLDELATRWRFERSVLPSREKEALRYELYRLGYHRARLFPDLDGLASHLAWKHAVAPIRTLENAMADALSSDSDEGCQSDEAPRRAVHCEHD